MPHKRAKRSIRESNRKEQGEDLAPEKHSLSNEPIPKSLARVLNAAKTREEWRLKKRKLEEDGDHKPGDKRRRLETGKQASMKGKEKGNSPSSMLTIKPGESIQHFNRRVEDDMRQLVKTAMQTSNAVVRNARKAEMEAKKHKNRDLKTKIDIEKEVKPTHRVRSPSPIPDKHIHKPKEFQKHSSSAPRRLNDIAQAPPEFKKVPRGATTSQQGSHNVGTGRRADILSVAQKSMMEKEREQAIKRYREMKAHRQNTSEKGDAQAE